VLVLYGHNPEDIHTWDDLVDRAPTPDVYYRPGYVRAYALSGHGRPVALLIRAGETQALLPLLVREFAVNGEIVRDAVTPYGYGGLLPLAGTQPVAHETVHDMLFQLRDWARASGLVACTLRLHPLLNQDELWADVERSEDWIRIFPRGETTAIRLGSWDAARRAVAGISKGRLYDLKKARSCLQLRIAQGQELAEDLEFFQQLYAEAMKRVNADEFFFFSPAYYDHLAEELGERLVVITAMSHDRPVSSAIFLADREFAHYHLAASNDEGRRCGAATLVVNTGAEWARQRGCSLLHLGGGLTADDSLWAFKHSFGGTPFFYSYMSIVGNHEQYEYLTSQSGVPWPYVDVHPPAGGAAEPGGRRSIRPSVHAGKKKVVGIGAGGHAKVIIDILSYSPDIEVVGLVELATRLFGETVAGSLILGDDQLLPELLAKGVGLAFIGIGGVSNNVPRAKSFELALSLGFDMINAIHPQAVLAKSARLGRGVCMMAGAVVNPAAEIGDNVILNTHCTVEHDCKIGDHVHIAPGATLSGAVQVGRLSHIGTGASVRQGIRIGESAIVGVGSVVVDDVPDNAVVVGSPARALKMASYK